MNDAIVVEGLSKQYQRYQSDKPKTIMEAVLLGWKRPFNFENFWALHNINLRVAFGEMLGVMGKNGSGKSTLLRLISGIGKPSQGKITINGKLRGLLDLGAGFHDDLTGQENVFVGGMVVGLSRQEVSKRFEAIVQFAELAEFINNPVRTYSSGMRIRLAFSVAIHTDPEILIIDEHIAVGDISFQEKCLERITELKESGCAIVFVSQSPQKIRQICDRALWLQDGKKIAYGEAEDVAKQYLAFIHTQQTRAAHINPHSIVYLPGLSLTKVQLTPASKIESGSSLTIQITYELQQRLSDFQIRIFINNDEGQICCATGRLRSQLSSTNYLGEEQVQLCFERLDLRQGKYFVNVVLAEISGHHLYDAHRNLHTLEIYSLVKNSGILNPPCYWGMVRANAPNRQKPD